MKIINLTKHVQENQVKIKALELKRFQVDPGQYVSSKSSSTLGS